MHGLEITRNGKRTIVAGGEAFISLNAVVAVYGKLGIDTENDAPPFGSITVLGVSESAGSNKQKMVTWNDERDIIPGDEIVIRFIEISKVTEPSETTEVDSNENTE